MKSYIFKITVYYYIFFVNGLKINNYFNISLKIINKLFLSQFN